MPRKTLVILLISFHAATFAQTEQHSVLAGGGFNMGFTIQDSIRTFTMNIAPNFGYFVAKNLMLGFSLGIGLTSDNRAKERKNRLFLNTSFIPNVRYYFLKGKSRPFLYGRFGYINSTSLIRGNMANTDGITGGGGVGLDYFATKNLAVEFALGVTATKIKNQSLSTQTGFSIGIQYFFNGQLLHSQLPAASIR